MGESGIFFSFTFNTLWPFRGGLYRILLVFNVLMTNTNLKELKKRFRKRYVSEWMFDDGANRLLWNDKAPSPNEMWNFIESAVLEDEGSVIGNNILMTHEDYKKVIDLAQEDERKRIVEVIKKYYQEFEEIDTSDDTYRFRFFIDDLLQKIKEME